MSIWFLMWFLWLRTLSQRGWRDKFKSQQRYHGHEASWAWPRPRPSLNPSSDVCGLKYACDHTIQREGDGKANDQRYLPVHKGLSLVRRNHYSHRSFYSHWLDKIRFVIFHCVKLSVSLAVCFKVTYSDSSFCMGSTAIRYNVGLCYIHLSLRPDDFEASANVSSLTSSDLLNAWYEKSARDARSVQETEEEVDLSFPWSCVMRKYCSGCTWETALHEVSVVLIKI